MDLRQYDPAIGRWVVQDPIVHHDFSPYSAFDNNPVYWSDPSGADATAYTLNGNLVGATFTGKDAIDAFFHLTDGSPEKTFEVAVTKFYEFSDFDENNGNGGGGGGDPFVGKKVLNAKTSTLGRLWATLEPRTWTSPYNLVYNVDADGIVTGIRPLGGLGVLGFVNGPNSFKLLKFGGDEAIAHFSKHANQIMKVTGKNAYNLGNYVDDANWIIKNGTYNSSLNGYYYFIGNSSKGEALFGFVGLKNNGSVISTFHIKTAKQLGIK